MEKERKWSVDSRTGINTQKLIPLMDFEGFSKGRNTKGVWKKDEKM